MKMMLNNDKCFVAKGGSLAFSSDGVERERIDPEEAKTAFQFDLRLHASYTQDGREIPGVMHMRRSDDDAVVPTRGLGREFVPVQHHELWNYVYDEMLPNLPDFTLETVGTLNGGGTGIIMGRFGDKFSVKGDKSPYENRLFIFNPNGKSSVTMGFTNVRLWCQNQLQAAVRTAGKSGFRIQHTKGASLVLDQALDSVRDMAFRALGIRRREEVLAGIPVGDAELNKMLNDLFPLTKFEEGSRGWTRMMNLRKAVQTQFTDGKTAQEFDGKSALMLFNAITYPMHNPGKIGDGTDVANIALSNTNGGRAARITRIFEKVEALVGAAA